MSDRVNIGVVGAGVFGSYHAAKYAANNAAALTAIYDVDFPRAELLAQNHGAKAYADFADFLNSIDAAIIATPASVHFGPAMAALEAGRHVFVEKPITPKVTESVAMIGAAKEHGLVLQVGHQERYVCAAAGLFDIAEKPLRIECERSAPSSNRCTDVSVVFDLMVHDIDIVRQLVHGDIVDLYAEGDAQDVSAEFLLFDGVVVSLRAARNADVPQRKMKLVYDSGIVEFDFINRRLDDRRQMAPSVTANGFNPTALALEDPLALGAELFIQAIRRGEKPKVSGEDGLSAVEWAVAIEDALLDDERIVPSYARMRA